MIKVGQTFHREVTFKVVKYNKETDTLTGVNDSGSIVILQRSHLEDLYEEGSPNSDK